MYQEATEIKVNDFLNDEKERTNKINGELGIISNKICEIKEKLSKEERAKIADAIKNNNVDTYKKVVGYDSMTNLEKIICMSFYQDGIDAFSNDEYIKRILHSIKNVTNNLVS